MSHLAEQRLGIVGATGAVGQEMLAILHQRAVPSGRLRLFASSRSAGGSVPYGWHEQLPVEHVESAAWSELDACLFAADAATAQAWVPQCIDAGCLVVDNSAAFRESPAVPLVIPEVNGELLSQLPRLVANPNCSTIILLVALEPLRCRWGIRDLRVATYQAVSGAGAAGIADLRASANAALSGADAVAGYFPQPSAFNVFCHESALDPHSGLCGEELKMIRESRKIWNSPQLRLVPFCVRVPVFRAHSQAISVELERPATRRQLRASLAAATGVRLIDDPASQAYPTPLAATGGDEVLVGRIRPARIPEDSATVAFDDDTPRTEWTIFAAGDQLRKGAALNAIQILQQMLANTATARCT